MICGSLLVVIPSIEVFIFVAAKTFGLLEQIFEQSAYEIMECLWMSRSLFGKLAKAVFYLIFIVGLFNLVRSGWVFITYEQDKEIAFVRNDSRPMELESLFCDENLLGKHLIHMADFSAAVYKDDSYVDAAWVADGWKRLEFTKQERDLIFPDEIVSGLKFGFWLNPEEKIGVISFRGTNGFLSWHANLHWLLKYLPIRTQYQKVNDAAPKLVDWLKARANGDIAIFATGHSLGGGLAQHALYSHPAIETAFAFNSSPVTGWHDLDSKSRDDAVLGNRVYRVHENGEALEFFRLLMKMGYLLNPKPNKDPFFEEYRLNFSSDNSFWQQHSIDGLVKELKNRRNDLC